MWSLVLTGLFITMFYKLSKDLVIMYWINKQLPGPKYSFPSGNIKDLKKYDHVCDALTQWSIKYGPTFRVWLGPFKCVIISTNPSHFKQVMVSNKDDWDIGDRPAIRRLTNESLLTLRNPHWQKQRSLMNPAFNYQKLREMTPIFDRQVKHFIQLCEYSIANGEPIDISNALSLLTLNIIGEAAFGTQLGLLEKVHKTSQLLEKVDKTSPLLEKVDKTSQEKMSSGAKQHVTPEKIRLLFESGGNTFTSLLMNFLPEWMFPQIKRQKAAVEEIRSVCRSMIEQRLAHQKNLGTIIGETSNNDLLGLLLECKEMKIEEIINESMAFLLAGHETTSTLMTWLLYALAINPGVDEKVYRELVEHKISEFTPTHEELRNLTYLNMTIDETCRLYPPIPLYVRKAEFNNTILKNENNSTIKVPKDSVIMFNVLGMHRDEKFWNDPLTFLPERFTDKYDKNDKIDKNTKRSRNNIVPFGTGPRRCIGQDFALLEVRSLLSQILSRYRFTLTPGHPDVKPKAFSLVVLKPGTRIMMSVHRR